MAAVAAVGDPEVPGSGGVHPIAQGGFNGDQALYELARPSYPPAVVAFIASPAVLPGLASPAAAARLAALDLAAGTGKWTRLLVPLGIGRLAAVEPAPAMREELHRQLSQAQGPLSKSILTSSSTAPPKTPVLTSTLAATAAAEAAQAGPAVAATEVEVVDGTATQIPYPDETFDAVYAAQAFHWFATVTALREIARVLKPSGVLVLIWNLEDKSKKDAGWVAKVRRLYERYESGTPQYRLGLWRRPFEEPAAVAELSELYELPIQEKQFEHSLKVTAEGVWLRVLSKSYVSLLDDETKARLRADVLSVLANDMSISWQHVDTPSGPQAVIEYPHTTDVVWLRKRPNATATKALA